jgi:hypothetical protein
MTDLVACIGTGKGTWTGVLKLANRQEFEKVFLVANAWTKDTLKMNKSNITFVLINSDDKTTAIRDSIIKQLQGKISAFEVAVNIDSGTGKEHTALLTALIQMGLALRFVVFEGDSMEEISMNMSYGLE